MTHTLPTSSGALTPTPDHVIPVIARAHGSPGPSGALRLVPDTTEAHKRDTARAAFLRGVAARLSGRRCSDGPEAA